MVEELGNIKDENGTEETTLAVNTKDVPISEGGY